MSKWMKQAFSAVIAAALIVPSGWLASDVSADAEQPDADTVTIVYHETFADGIGKAVQSGGASLEQVSDKVFDGNEDGGALYVNNRTHDYDAADFNYTDLGIKNGKTYTITVKGFVDAEATVPDDAQAYLQTVDKSYGWLAGAAFRAGEAFTLTKEFTLDTSSGDTRLRVQSNSAGATVPFYLGDILITEKADSDGGGNEEPPRDPALPFSTITFEDQTPGGFEGRSGTEKLTVTDEANHTPDGAYALKVEGRTATWHGPSLRVEKYVDKGAEYKISAWVKLIRRFSCPPRSAAMAAQIMRPWPRKRSAPMTAGSNLKERTVTTAWVANT